MQNTILQVMSNKGKINQSQLKIIACVCMLLSDYLLCFGWKGWGIVKGNGLDFYEIIGQVAFPLFSFGIVCSIEKSRNIHLFINRLLFLAIVSQIPFTMAFYPANLHRIGSANKPYYFTILWIYIIIFIIIIWGVCIGNNDITKNGKILLIIAGIISSFNLCMEYTWFNYTDRLNIGYLYWGSIVVLNMINSWREASTVEKIWKFISISFILIFLISRVDYGISCSILIIIFYLFKDYRMLQCVGVVLWGCVFYGIIYDDIFLSISSVVSAIIISRYNGERGKTGKGLFYLFYPLHLFIFGIVNMYLRY